MKIKELIEQLQAIKNQDLECAVYLEGQGYADLSRIIDFSYPDDRLLLFGRKSKTASEA